MNCTIYSEKRKQHSINMYASLTFVGLEEKSFKHEHQHRHWQHCSTEPITPFASEERGARRNTDTR